MSLESGENPIRVIRQRQGLSQRRAAEKIGCHYQLVYMSEHGMYWNIPHAVLKWASESGDYAQHYIENAYCVFRQKQREDASVRYSLRSLPVDILGKPGENPLVALRNGLGLSQSGFCKAFCIPVATVYLAERDLYLPMVLMTSLTDLKIPISVIKEMDARFEIM